VKANKQPWIAPGVLPLLAPFFILFALFWLVPLIGGLRISMQSNTLLGEPEFVGLTHFKKVLGDRLFYLSLKNTALYTLGNLLLILPFATLLAVLLRRTWSRLRPLLSYALLLPALTPPIVLGVLFLLVFHGREGLLNQLFVTPFGLKPINWIKDPSWILPALVLQSTWRWTGFMAFFIGCGLEGLPRTTQEAASLDGAGPVRSFFAITLPQLRPVLIFCAAYLFVDAFAMFSGAYLLLGGSGGTANAGLLVVTYVYQTAFFPHNEFGTAAAMSLMTVPVLLLVCWGLFAFRPKAASRMAVLK